MEFKRDYNDFKKIRKRNIEWYLNSIYARAKERLSLDELKSLKNTFDVIQRLKRIQCTSVVKWLDETIVDHLNYEIDKLRPFLFDKNTNTVVLTQSRKMTELLVELRRIEDLDEFYKFKERLKRNVGRYEKPIEIEIRKILENLDFILIRSIGYDVNEVYLLFDKLTQLFAIKKPKEREPTRENQNPYEKMYHDILNNNF